LTTEVVLNKQVCNKNIYFAKFIQHTTKYKHKDQHMTC